MDGNTDSTERQSASDQPAKNLSVEATDGGSLVLPEGLSLAQAEFAQDGPDLVLTFPDGSQVVVEGFFNLPNPPKLVSADGAQVPGDVAAQMATPETQVAQNVQADSISAGTDDALPGFTPQPLAGDSIIGRAVAGTDGSPIGVVQNMSGTAVAVRADGTRVTLEPGSPVYQGDILETADDGSLGILLADQTTFSMGENGRMVLDEMVYDPSNQTGSVSLSVLQGVFTFVSGQVAKTDPDAMTLNTPVATIGIRGTQVGLEIPDGKALNIVLMEEADGFVGEVVVSNAGGTRVMNGASDFTSVKSFDTVAAAVTKIDTSRLLDSFASALRHLPKIHGNQNDYGLQEQRPPEKRADAEAIANFQTAAGGEQAPPVQETIKVVAGDFTKAAETIEVVEAAPPPPPPPPPPSVETTIVSVRRDEITINTVVDTGPQVPAGVVGAFVNGVLVGTVAGNFDGSAFSYDMHLTGSDAGNLIIGGSGDDSIFGGGGDDTLEGGAGDDFLVGGAGNDVFIGGAGRGFDTFVGNEGIDEIRYISAGVDNPLYINLAQGVAYDLDPNNPWIDQDVLSGIENVIGGAGNDIIIGDDGVNVLVGGAGDDTLNGGGGDDILIGGIGNDILIGGAGNDRLEGGAGNDILYGDGGADILIGGDGDDTLIGGAGNDTLIGGAGNDILIGGTGDNVLIGGEGQDRAVFTGTFGNFTISFDANGVITIAGADGTTILDGIEEIAFDDGTFTADQLRAPDTYDIDVTNLTGNEDTPIPLLITVTDPNTATTETVSITISGVPEGATLSAGTRNDDGTWTLTREQLTDLKITPPADSNVDFQLTVTATATNAIGGTSTSTATIDVNLVGVADAPTLTASVGPGQIVGDSEEVGSITLSVAKGGWGNTGEFEVFVNGQSVGVFTTNVAHEATGQWQSITISGLSLSADDDPVISIQPTSSESHILVNSIEVNGHTLEAEADGALGSVIGNPPESGGVLHETYVKLNPNGELNFTLDDDVFDDVAGTVFPLNIDAALTDTDNSETLSITVAGLPEGATLTAGTQNADGTWTLTADQLEGLKLFVPGDADQNFALTVSATATENDGDTETVSVSVAVGTEDVIADDPTFAVTDATGDEDTAIPLDIDAALTDTDGSEVLSITIAGVPVGAVLSAGTKNADGTWTLTEAQLDGLTITPAPNSSGDFALTVTATVTNLASGDTAIATGTLNVDVTAVADPPTLDLSDALGLEDALIPLDISAAVTDPSETLSVTISGVPVGATLYAGTFPDGSPIPLVVNQPGGTATIPVDQLDSVLIKPPAGSDADFDLAVIATSTDEGAIATTTGTLHVDVMGVPDTPTLVVSDASGSEDTAIPLDIQASLGDDSEMLSITIAGVPDGATLSAGTHNPDGTWTLTTEQLDGLTITPPENTNEDFTLVVTAVSSENGEIATTVATLDVAVAGVADAPTLAVSIGPGVVIDGDDGHRKGSGTGSGHGKGTGSGHGRGTGSGHGSGSGTGEGEDGTQFALDIDTSLVDTDGSETLSITVGGLLEGVTLSAGTHNADGTWTLTPDQLEGLTMFVPEGVSADFNVTVTATAAENDGDTASTSAAVQVGVDSSASDPTLEVSDAAGAEDTAIPLDLSAALTDTDGSESLSITISGIPEGAVLKAGDQVIEVTNGAATLSPDQLTGLTLTPPPNSNADIDLSISAVSTESHGGDTATTTDNLHIDVVGVADAPEASAQDAQGGEDQWIPLHLDAALTDTDGSESLSITLAGVPEGAVLSHGVRNDDGTWTVAPEQLADLSILPPENFSGEIPLTLNVTATENDGDSVTVSKEFTVSVAEAADAPTLVVANASGNEDSPIPLTINAALTDESETLSVTIAGVPEGAVLSAGTHNPDGTWTLTPQQLQGLTLTPPANSNQDFQLTVTASSSTPAGAAAVSALIAVAVAGVADAPTVDASLSEPVDRVYQLDITGMLADTDGSESLSFQISGLPEGATLSAGTDNGDGTWSLQPGELDGLTLTVGNEISEGFDLTVQAISMEDDGSTATSVVNVHVDVEPVEAPGQTLVGGSGKDTLTGDAGDDTLFGQSGDDRLLGEGGDDTLYGGSGKDTLEGGAGNDTLYGESGDDKLYGGAGDDTLYGESGDDRLYGEAGADTLYGGSGEDTLDGGDSQDFLFGDDGEDVLYGGAGNDVLNAGSGDDKLYGGAGDDTLTGGSGKDTFVFDADSGFDIITDIMDQDKIVFEGQEFNAQDLVFSKDEQSGDVVISFSGVEGTKVKLDGVKYDDLTQGHGHGSGSGHGYSVSQDHGQVTIQIDTDKH
jgi:Ca2+-binding RTX toxin-like protein